MIKKIVSPLLYPLTVSLILLVLSLALLMRKKPPRIGKVLLFLGLITILASSYSFVSDRLVRYLEGRYPPVVSAEPLSKQNVKTIVVLGGGVHPTSRLPLSSQLSRDTLVRLFEGVRLYREIPGAVLVVSGGAVYHREPESSLMAKAAVTMGVDPRDIIEEWRSADTLDQARLVKPLVGSRPFVIVTAAVHMPRSMMAFRNEGLNPLAAPTDHLAKVDQPVTPMDFYPDPISLENTRKAVHELLGIAWLKLRSSSIVKSILN